MLPESDNILIVSLRRSGGKLVRTLLDGHPAFRAIPFEHWHTAKKSRYPGSILERFHSLTAKEKLEIIGFRVTARKLATVHGESAAAPFIDQMPEVAERAATVADLYHAFVDSYFETFQALGPAGKVVNHSGSLALMTSEQLDTLFGPSTKIVIWRDPRAAYASAKALGQQRGQVDSGDQLTNFCLKYQTAFNNYFSSENISLRFEELVQHPDIWVPRLAEALNVDVHPSLFTPTILGQPCRANSSFQRSFGTIDATAALDWEERLDAHERDVIEDRLAGPIAALSARASAGITEISG